MHKYGDCSFCGGEVIEEKLQLEYCIKKDLYVFNEVPVGVCAICGEKFLIAIIAKKIQDQIERNTNWAEIISVPVGIFSEE